MPPRIPLLAALRQPLAFFKIQSSNLSTTAAAQALRNDVPNATSSLLSLDEGSSSPSSARRGSTPSLSSPNTPGTTPNSTESASGMFDRLRQSQQRRGSAEQRGELVDQLRARNNNDDYMRQLTRRWNVGDVYAPHDLSPSEMGKWRRNQARKKDLVDMLGLRPLDMYRNFSVMSEFMTPHGRIKRSVDTGLRPPNQRKMAKAIRRAIGLGIHPSVHRHPELLMREHARTHAQSQATMAKDLKW